MTKTRAIQRKIDQDGGKMCRPGSSLTGH